MFIIENGLLGPAFRMETAQGPHAALGYYLEFKEKYGTALILHNRKSITQVQLKALANA